MRDVRIGLLLVLIFALSLLSCWGECDKSSKNKEIVIQANDALNAHDIDKMLELYADDFVRHCQATPGAEIGDLETFKKLSEDWMTATPDAKQTIHMLVAEGDLVAFHTTFEGTHEGQMGPFPPTGKKMSAGISEACYQLNLDPGRFIPHFPKHHRHQNRPREIGGGDRDRRRRRRRVEFRRQSRAFSFAEDALGRMDDLHATIGWSDTTALTHKERV